MQVRIHKQLVSEAKLCIANDTESKTDIINYYVCRRRPLTVKEQSKVSDDLSVSANVAYGQVKMAESSTVPDVYEELGALAGGGAPDYATCAAGIQATPTLKTQ